MPVPSNPAPALELIGVTAGYDPRRPPVLADLTVSVPSRGVHRLLGHNGAGKSTVVEVASGHLRPRSGVVRVCGLDASDPGARSLRRVCRTAPALYPLLTVAEHLELASVARGVSLPEATERAAAYGLMPWADMEAKELSTGNARRLWFVICTLGDFRIALLDEPFNALDDTTRQTMTAEITRWAADRAVVLVAHEPPAGLAVSGTIVLGAGSQVADRAPAEVGAGGRR
jgi:ABC-type multidrug transport system ATPase subunit